MTEPSSTTESSDLLDLAGKVCLVTGAGQGIGREVALTFARHGAGGVVVNDFFTERAEVVAAEVEALGTPALAAQADVSDYAAVEAMVAETLERFERLDVVVNNAGNMGPDPDAVTYDVFWKTPPDMWDKWIGVNFRGVLNCAHAALAPMIDRGEGGRIITVISEAARFGDPRLAVYAGAKAGAAGFMRSIAREAARYGITANNVAIGGTKTPTVAPDPETEAKVIKAYPLRRMGEPVDIANMVLFLASDASSWITGQTYPVNGGFTFNL